MYNPISSCNDIPIRKNKSGLPNNTDSNKCITSMNTSTGKRCIVSKTKGGKGYICKSNPATPSYFDQEMQAALKIDRTLSELRNKYNLKFLEGEYISDINKDKLSFILNKYQADPNIINELIRMVTIKDKKIKRSEIIDLARRSRLDQLELKDILNLIYSINQRLLNETALQLLQENKDPLQVAYDEAVEEWQKTEPYTIERLAAQRNLDKAKAELKKYNKVYEEFMQFNQVEQCSDSEEKSQPIKECHQSRSEEGGCIVSRVAEDGKFVNKCVVLPQKSDNFIDYFKYLKKKRKDLESSLLYKDLRKENLEIAAKKQEEIVKEEQIRKEAELEQKKETEKITSLETELSEKEKIIKELEEKLEKFISEERKAEEAARAAEMKAASKRIGEETRCMECFTELGDLESWDVNNCSSCSALSESDEKIDKKFKHPQVRRFFRIRKEHLRQLMGNTGFFQRIVNALGDIETAKQWLRNFLNPARVQKDLVEAATYYNNNWDRLEEKISHLEKCSECAYRINDPETYRLKNCESCSSPEIANGIFKGATPKEAAKFFEVKGKFLKSLDEELDGEVFEYFEKALGLSDSKEINKILALLWKDARRKVSIEKDAGKFSVYYDSIVKEFMNYLKNYVEVRNGMLAEVPKTININDLPNIRIKLLIERSSADRPVFVWQIKKDGKWEDKRSWSDIIQEDNKILEGPSLDLAKEIQTKANVTLNPNVSSGFPQFEVETPSGVQTFNDPKEALVNSVKIQKQIEKLQTETDEQNAALDVKVKYNPDKYNFEYFVQGEEQTSRDTIQQAILDSDAWRKTSQEKRQELKSRLPTILRADAKITLLPNLQIGYSVGSDIPNENINEVVEQAMTSTNPALQRFLNEIKSVGIVGDVNINDLVLSTSEIGSPLFKLEQSGETFENLNELVQSKSIEKIQKMTEEIKTYKTFMPVDDLLKLDKNPYNIQRKLKKPENLREVIKSQTLEEVGFKVEIISPEVTADVKESYFKLQDKFGPIFRFGPYIFKELNEIFLPPNVFTDQLNKVAEISMIETNLLKDIGLEFELLYWPTEQEKVTQNTKLQDIQFSIAYEIKEVEGMTFGFNYGENEDKRILPLGTIVSQIETLTGVSTDFTEKVDSVRDKLMNVQKFRDIIHSFLPIKKDGEEKVRVLLNPEGSLGSNQETGISPQPSITKLIINQPSNIYKTLFKTEIESNELIDEFENYEKIQKKVITYIASGGTLEGNNPIELFFFDGELNFPPTYQFADDVDKYEEAILMYDIDDKGNLIFKIEDTDGNMIDFSDLYWKIELEGIDITDYLGINQSANNYTSYILKHLKFRINFSIDEVVKLFNYIFTENTSDNIRNISRQMQGEDPANFEYTEPWILINFLKNIKDYKRFDEIFQLSYISFDEALSEYKLTLIDQNENVIDSKQTLINKFLEVFPINFNNVLTEFNMLIEDDKIIIEGLEFNFEELQLIDKQFNLLRIHEVVGLMKTAIKYLEQVDNGELERSIMWERENKRFYFKFGENKVEFLELYLPQEYIPQEQQLMQEQYELQNQQGGSAEEEDILNQVVLSDGTVVQWGGEFNNNENDEYLIQKLFHNTIVYVFPLGYSDSLLKQINKKLDLTLGSTYNQFSKQIFVKSANNYELFKGPINNLEYLINDIEYGTKIFEEMFEQEKEKYEKIVKDIFESYQIDARFSSYVNNLLETTINNEVKEFKPKSILYFVNYAPWLRSWFGNLVKIGKAIFKDFKLYNDSKKWFVSIRKDTLIPILDLTEMNLEDSESINENLRLFKQLANEDFNRNNYAFFDQFENLFEKTDFTSDVENISDDKFRSLLNNLVDINYKITEEDRKYFDYFNQKYIFNYEELIKVGENGIIGENFNVEPFFASNVNINEQYVQQQQQGGNLGPYVDETDKVNQNQPNIKKQIINLFKPGFFSKIIDLYYKSDEDFKKVKGDEAAIKVIKRILGQDAQISNLDEFLNEITNKFIPKILKEQGPLLKFKLYHEPNVPDLPRFIIVDSEDNHLVDFERKKDNLNIYYFGYYLKDLKNNNKHDEMFQQLKQEMMDEIDKIGYEINPDEVDNDLLFKCSFVCILWNNIDGFSTKYYYYPISQMSPTESPTTHHTCPLMPYLEPLKDNYSSIVFEGQSIFPLDINKYSIKENGKIQIDFDGKMMELPNGKIMINEYVEEIINSNLNYFPKLNEKIDSIKLPEGIDSEDIITKFYLFLDEDIKKIDLFFTIDGEDIRYNNKILYNEEETDELKEDTQNLINEDRLKSIFNTDKVRKLLLGQYLVDKGAQLELDLKYGELNVKVGEETTAIEDIDDLKIISEEKQKIKKTILYQDIVNVNVLFSTDQGFIIKFPDSSISYNELQENPSKLLEHGGYVDNVNAIKAKLGLENIENKQISFDIKINNEVMPIVYELKIIYKGDAFDSIDELPFIREEIGRINQEFLEKTINDQEDMKLSNYFEPVVEKRGKVMIKLKSNDLLINPEDNVVNFEPTGENFVSNIKKLKVYNELYEKYKKEFLETDFVKQIMIDYEKRKFYRGFRINLDSYSFKLIFGWNENPRAIDGEITENKLDNLLEQIKEKMQKLFIMRIDVNNQEQIEQNKDNLYKKDGQLYAISDEEKEGFKLVLSFNKENILQTFSKVNKVYFIKELNIDDMIRLETPDNLYTRDNKLFLIIEEPKEGFLPLIGEESLNSYVKIGQGDIYFQKELSEDDLRQLKSVDNLYKKDDKYYIISQTPKEGYNIIIEGVQLVGYIQVEDIYFVKEISQEDLNNIGVDQEVYEKDNNFYLISNEPKEEYYAVFDDEIDDFIKIGDNPQEQELLNLEQEELDPFEAIRNSEEDQMGQQTEQSQQGQQTEQGEQGEINDFFQSNDENQENGINVRRNSSFDIEATDGSDFFQNYEEDQMNQQGQQTEQAEQAEQGENNDFFQSDEEDNDFFQNVRFGEAQIGQQTEQGQQAEQGENNDFFQSDEEDDEFFQNVRFGEAQMGQQAEQTEQAEQAEQGENNDFFQSDEEDNDFFQNVRFGEAQMGQQAEQAEQGQQAEQGENNDFFQSDEENQQEQIRQAEVPQRQNTRQPEEQTEGIIESFEIDSNVGEDEDDDFIESQFGGKNKKK